MVLSIGGGSNDPNRKGPRAIAGFLLLSSNRASANRAVAYKRSRPKGDLTMSLWKAGTLEGITAEVLSALTADAFETHAEGDTAGMLAAEKMPIKAVEEIAEGDNAFDRCSHAMHSGETFEHCESGQAITHTYKVADYFGRPWNIIPVDSTDVRTCDKISIGEKELAAILTAANGPLADPYCTMVEVAYNKAGNVAGYGVRKSGKFELFYN